MQSLWCAIIGNTPLFPPYVHFRFSEIRQSILETAKSLVDDTKALVNSAASSQESLAQAALKAQNTISKEVDYAKLGAMALGSDDTEGQVRGGRGEVRGTGEGREGGGNP